MYASAIFLEKSKGRCSVLICNIIDVRESWFGLVDCVKIGDIEYLSVDYKDLPLLNNIIESCNGEEENLKNIVRVKFFADKKDVEMARHGDYYDLRSAIDKSYKAGEAVLIPLGVGMILPTGYSAIVVPRSSTFKNFGLIMTNSMGIIDNAYCGDNDQWHFAGYAFRDGHISKGDRLCQFRLEKIQPQFHFIEVKSLFGEDRGGFGSTGVR